MRRAHGFVHRLVDCWPQSAVEECLLFRRCQRMSRRLDNGPKTTLMTQTGHGLAQRNPVGLGSSPTTSFRDTKPFPASTDASDRALRNYLETFPFFAASNLIAAITNTHDWLTLWGAHFYFWGGSATRCYIGQICLLLVRSFGMSRRLAS